MQATDGQIPTALNVEVDARVVFFTRIHIALIERQIRRARADVGEGRPAIRISIRIRECFTFVDLSERILDADLDSGFLITEDFGSATFVTGNPPAPIASRAAGPISI